MGDVNKKDLDQTAALPVDEMLAPQEGLGISTTKVSVLARKARKQAAEITAIKGIPPDPPHFLLARLTTEVPFFAGLLGRINTANNGILQLIDLIKNSKNLMQQAKPITGPAGIALAAVDLVRIPVVFFASWLITGERPPFELTKAGRWAYTGVVVALAAVAFAVPVTAPFIAIAASLAAGAVGVASMIKMMKDLDDIKKELHDIDAQLKPFTDIQSRISTLNSQLKGLDRKAPGYAEESAQVCKLIKEEYVKYTEFKNNVPEFQKLLNRKLLLEKKQETLGPWTLADKAVGAILPALAAIFLSLSLIFPPLALGAAAVGGVGLLYGVSRFAVPRIAPYVKSAISNIGAWFTETFGSTNEEKPSTTLNKGLELNVDNNASMEVHNSTQLMASMLSDNMDLSAREVSPRSEIAVDDVLDNSSMVVPRQEGIDGPAVVENMGSSPEMSENSEARADYIPGRS